MGFSPLFSSLYGLFWMFWKDGELFPNMLFEQKLLKMGL